MQSIIGSLKSNIISLEMMVTESSVDSNTIANKLTKALETITMQQSTINDQSSTNSSLNTQLMLANATVTSLNARKKELKIDVAYLVNRQKYSALVANKLKKANETILNLQTNVQSLNRHSTQNNIIMIIITMIMVKMIIIIFMVGKN
mmetsp:Transcript_14372/g.13870  ORF Transcript_14372/g.13870 Transcript_14372/m.13870 type:complete len:148 (-) Transcript_14372:260-703(-)